jgi:hypothetical protein
VSIFFKNLRAFNLILSLKEAREQVQGDKVAAKTGNNSNSVAFSLVQTSKKSFQSKEKKGIVKKNMWKKE